LRKILPSGALWAHAGFLRLWAAQTVSSFGARIAREGFAMSAILSIHAGPMQLGVLSALTVAPGILVGLTAGGFVDRSRRRRVMIGSDLSRTALLLTVPLAAWLHVLTMPQLFVVAAVAGAANALFDIADHAYLPSLIGRGHLIEGNSRLGVTESVAEIGGPALAGMLFQILTPPLAMLGTALTYLVSALFLLSIPNRETLPDISGEKPPHWRDDLRLGLRAILCEPLVRPLFWMALFAPLFGSFFAALYMIYGIEVLGFSPALMGLVIATGGVGALFGTALASILSRRIGIGPAIVACGIASSFLVFLIPMAGGPLWLRAAMMMLTQFGGDAAGLAVIILSTSLRQAILPPEMLGRTAAIFRAATGVAVIGALAGGWLATMIGIRATLFVAAATYFLTPLFAAFSPLRKLREIPDEARVSDQSPP
jgi:MFS family permease